MEKHNIVREIRELKNQLSYSKNIGFFFGAGSSCALGIPNIAQLTTEVATSLTGDSLQYFDILMKDLQLNMPGETVNIENMLNHIRQLREITGDRSDKSYQNVDGASGKQLDIDICNAIYTIISAKESGVKLEITKRFLAWLSMQNRDFSKEIFTTNYDLILEKSFEETRIPYFDGFVGAYEPFFWQESVDTFVNRSDLTQKWIRLWKLHGSLSWFWKEDVTTHTHKIIRIGDVSNIDRDKNELVIYPSKEKYDSSRKQPFIAYFDRLKNYLLNGELLFIFVGYSFSDQHINDIILNCLRQNNRLFALVFFFQDDEVASLYRYSSSYLNLNALGPTKAIINGVMGEWDFQNDQLKPSENADIFWDSANNNLMLGDFNHLVKFLITTSGKKDMIEAIANEN